MLARVSEECIHRLDGMTECLCKDSEAGYRENTATVLECNMLSESVRERLFWFVFQGAGLTDAVCAFTGSGPWLLLD